MQREYHFETELAARLFMADLKARGVRYTYWHMSVCHHYVTVKS